MSPSAYSNPAGNAVTMKGSGGSEPGTSLIRTVTKLVSAYRAARGPAPYIPLL